MYISTASFCCFVTVTVRCSRSFSLQCNWHYLVHKRFTTLTCRLTVSRLAKTQLADQKHLINFKLITSLVMFVCVFVCLYVCHANFCHFPQTKRVDRFEKFKKDLKSSRCESGNVLGPHFLFENFFLLKNRAFIECNAECGRPSS